MICCVTLAPLAFNGLTYFILMLLSILSLAIFQFKGEVRWVKTISQNHPFPQRFVFGPPSHPYGVGGTNHWAQQTICHVAKPNDHRQKADSHNCFDSLRNKGLFMKHDNPLCHKTETNEHWWVTARASDYVCLPLPFLYTASSEVVTSVTRCMCRMSCVSIPV